MHGEATVHRLPEFIHSVSVLGFAGMDPDDYRTRARRCRVAAARSDHLLRADFLDAAEAWDLLADQLERLEKVAGSLPAREEPGGPAGSDTR